ncbi:TadE/TadG family type IV pilus assembly protein [Yoonia sp. R78084]|uniref:TadE/TadG family type IV pilus assembly protein n=1 Tax=Yoonia sp. R78084 TaxID=3093869 RepID=UPI0037DC9846
MMNKATHLARQFRDDEQGSMAIELLLVVPILLWVFLSTFVYFDVYRVETNSVRATITLAEMFSREGSVDNNYLNNAREVLRELTFEEANPDLRVTVYRQRADGEFRTVWSRNRGMDGGNLTNAQINAIGQSGRLPNMREFDHAIYIETRTEYDAPFNIGLGPFTVTNLEDLTFTNDMVIRPRGPRLCFITNASAELCGPG